MPSAAPRLEPALRDFTILDAMSEPELFGPLFQGDWRAWRAFLAAVFGLRMGPHLRALFQQHTGRQTPPAGQVSEAWMLVGRGGGKSRIAGLIATFLACFCDWRACLATGQLALIPVIAADKDQARVVFGYITGLFEAVPAIRALIKGKPRAAGIDLHTGVTIEVRAASFRTIRGYALVAAVLDEIAYWMTGEASLNPDHEILNAMRPGLARVPGSVLIGLSSPYARRGVLWEAYDKHYGKEGDPVLVWKADTRAMNPTFPQAEIDKALAEDAAKGAAEYLVEFRSDLQAYVDPEVVRAATVPDRRELPPTRGVQYHAFTDPSGGSADAFTLAIGHVSDGKGIVDCLRERRPPFAPSAVVAEFADVLRAYGCTTVRGDHYAGEWPREQFAKHGITYQTADQTKSELYVAFLPALNSGRVELLDVARLGLQLCQLERRTSRAGKDSIDHPPGGHDDIVNAVAGCLAPLVGGVGDGMGFFNFLEAQRPAPSEPAPPAPSSWAGGPLVARRPSRAEQLAGLVKLEERSR